MDTDHAARLPAPAPLAGTDLWRAVALAARPSAADPAAWLDLLAAALHAEAAALYLVGPEPPHLSLHAARGPAAPALPAGLAHDEGVVGLVLRHGQPLILPGPPPGPPLAPPGPALVLPLIVDAAPLGALYLARPAGAPPFAPADLLLATLAADREAAALARLAARPDPDESLLAQISESLPSSLLVIDRALRVVSANRHFLEKARRDARSTIGRPVDEVFPPAIARYIQIGQRAREVFQSGRSSSDDRLAFRAPGLPTRVFFYRLIPLRRAGVVEHLLLLLDDITERERLGEEVRRAERHLASVVECAGDLVASLDRVGRVVTWNRAAEQLSGVPMAAAVGRSLVDLCAPDHRPALAAMLEQLARGQEVRDVEADLVAAPAHVPVAWSGAPMRDDADRVVALVVVGRDLTERRRLELQLVQSAKSASLGVMAGGIAHEIRNPLGIIVAAAQTLLDQECAEPLHAEAAERISRAAMRAAGIIDDLLTFARPDQSPARPVLLNALVEESLALIMHQPMMRKITIELALRADLPTIHGKPGLLQQVMINLLLNACKAMPEGGRLRVTSEAAPGAALVAVSDTGSGIAPDLLPRIFDPFFTTMPVGQGVGLGLAICDSIVRQHGGSIEVWSQVGVGSSFTVRLPVTAGPPRGSG